MNACIILNRTHVEYWFLQWPPALVHDYYDIPYIVQTCKDRCQVNPDEVKRFEASNDFNNLPSSKELRCFLHCNMVESGVLEPDSVRLNITKTMDLYMQLPKEDQVILSGMGRGCMQKTRRIKDPYEFAYQINVCAKQNDNEVTFGGV